MLRRIHIKGYKSLQDVEIRLRPLSVITGPNAAGKSNLLDALQLMSRIATRRNLKEAFDPPYRGLPLESFTFGPDGIEGLVSSDSASFSIEVDLELSPGVIKSVNQQITEMKRTRPSDEQPAAGPSSTSYVTETLLRYRVEVEILPRSGFLRVADEYLAALTTDGVPTRKRKPFLEQMGGKMHLRMERQAHPTYYERLLDHTILSMPLYPPHYPHLTAVRQELANWHIFYFEPRERMRAPNPVKEVRHIGLMGEELAAFLNTLKATNEMQFKSVEKSLHALIPSVSAIDVAVNKLGLVELKLIENGTPIPAGLLSEGTLRILGLLALRGAREPPSLIGFEEPENGVHPRRIQLIARLLETAVEGGTTQYIVTTHSPTLLDNLPDDSIYVARKEKGKSVILPFQPWGALGGVPEIRRALEDEGERLSVSQRMLRGDLDG